MTNFNEEFAKVFSNNCGPSTDWSQPQPFNGSTNECYKREAALMASLTSEAYNNFGFEVEYYIKKISTKQDRLYGEDTLENFERRFKLKVYTDSIPQLQRQYELQGMAYTEIVTLQATIAHFTEASTVDYITGEQVWDSYYPKIGDVMYFPWCDLYYEVLNVKEFAENTSFLQTPVTFTFSLRVWRNSHESVDITNVNDDKMEHLRSYVELAETFDIAHKTDNGPFEHITEPVSNEAELPTSKVASTGDMLNTNETIEKEMKNVDYDPPPTKSFDPFADW